MVCTSPLFAKTTIDPYTGKKSNCFIPSLVQQFRDGNQPSVVGQDANLEFISRFNCGQCISCRLARSREWATRCCNEALMHDQNCFLTLTYDDDHLPPDGSIRIKEMQSFMKRLKKKFSSYNIRRFYSGEYGDITYRPHYHCILFGIDFSHDRKLLFVKDDYRYYNSESLDSVWQKGHAVIGEFSFDTAAYVARYTMKKVNGPRAHAHYRRVDKNGDEYFLEKEFAKASNKPAIGKTWFDKYAVSDVLAYDRIVVDSNAGRGYSKPPRYYDKLSERRDAEFYKMTKEKRMQEAQLASDNPDLAFRRLQDRAECVKSRLKAFVRDVC